MEPLEMVKLKSGDSVPIRTKEYLKGKLASPSNEYGLERLGTVKYKGKVYDYYDSGFGNMHSSYRCLVLKESLRSLKPTPSYKSESRYDKMSKKLRDSIKESLFKDSKQYRVYYKKKGQDPINLPSELVSAEDEKSAETNFLFKFKNGGDVEIVKIYPIDESKKFREFMGDIIDLHTMTRERFDSLPYGTSFMSNRASISVDGKEYVKLSPDTWQYLPTVTHALGYKVSADKMWDIIQKGKSAQMVENKN